MPDPGTPEGSGEDCGRVDQRDPGRAGTLRVPDAVHRRYELGTDRGEDRVWRESGLCEDNIARSVFGEKRSKMKNVRFVRFVRFIIELGLQARIFQLGVD